MNGKVLFFLFCLCFLVIGCRGGKVKTNVQKTEKEQIKMVDTLIIDRTITKADTIFVSVPYIQTRDANCDSICNKEVRKELSKIRYKDSQKGFYFDKDKSELRLYSTANQEYYIYKSKYKDKEKESIRTEDKIIYKSYIPKYIYFLFVVCVVVGVGIGYKIFK